MLKSIRVHFFICFTPIFSSFAINWANINSMRCIVNASNANNSKWKCDFLVSSHFSLCVCVDGLKLASIPITVAMIDMYHTLARHTAHKIFIELCNANMLNLQTHSFFLFVRFMPFACLICLNLSLSIGTTNAWNYTLRLSQSVERSSKRRINVASLILQSTQSQ